MPLPLEKPSTERPRFGQPGYDMAADLAALDVQLASAGNWLTGLCASPDEPDDGNDCEPSADELMRTEGTFSI